MTEKVISAVQVDLGKAPTLPFEDTQVVVHQGSGVATLELRTSGLYLDGLKIVLRQVEQQQDTRIKRDDLRKQLDGTSVLNANVLDALFDLPQLIPEDWRKTGMRVFFWGTVYRHNPYQGVPRAAGGGYRDLVRCLSYEVTRYNRRHSSSRFLCGLEATDMDCCWAAVLESAV